MALSRGCGNRRSHGGGDLHRTSIHASALTISVVAYLDLDERVSNAPRWFSPLPPRREPATPSRLTAARASAILHISAPDRAPPTRGEGTIPTCHRLKRGAVHLLSA